MTTALGNRIRADIQRSGPMSVAAYMTRCLSDPKDGYYMRGDPFGRGGDFITAPEVSQMFGELIGAWCLDLWTKLGSPAAFSLVELGPGRGTLMADLLHMAAIRPAFLAAASLHLVETSPALRACQAETLKGAPIEPTWHDRIDMIPDAPLIVVANEFFDALPIHQYVKTTDGWRERMIGVDSDGNLAFGIGENQLPDAALPATCRRAETGAILETSPVSTAITAALSDRITRQGGGALIIDYGHGGTAPGETLQAVKNHQFADPLAEPGDADLTAHVDFSALAAAARDAGAEIHPLLGQGDFLIGLGLLERAGALGANADETVRKDLHAAVERLAGPSEMGSLFKALAITPKNIVSEPFDR